jgi:hypothetical protein
VPNVPVVGATENDTVALTTAELLFCTRAQIDANADPAATDCAAPDDCVIVAVAGNCTFTLNDSGEPVRPVEVAVTVCAPAASDPPSVQLAEATPDEFVVTVTDPVNEPEGVADTVPPPLAVNVTEVPLTKLPFVSVTVTESGVATSVLAGADCASPPDLAMLVAEEADTVSANVTCGVELVVVIDAVTVTPCALLPAVNVVHAMPLPLVD